MKPVLERPDQVVARVVAWHNRHPLAQRITPEQVHSVGVVSLPFAVQGAIAGEPIPVEAAPAAPPDSGAAAVPTPAAQAVGEAPPEAVAETHGAAPDESPTEDAVEAVVELVVDAPAVAEALPTDAPDDTPALAEAGSRTPPPADEGEATILDRALQGPAAAAAAALPEPLVPTPAQPAQPQTAPPVLPARRQPWHPRSWWAQLRGRSAYRALFSEDFIAPLRPARVARWVAAHGVAARPLGPDDPTRQIALDPARRRAGDPAREVELHVITAAIGVDDHRHRLLLTPDGQVLGRREWDVGRVFGSAGMAAAAVCGVALGLGLAPWLGLGGADAPPAGRVERLASAASHPAPGASAPAHDAVAIRPASAPSAASAPTSAGSAPASFAASVHAASAPARSSVSDRVARAAEPATSAPPPGRPHGPVDVAKAPDAHGASGPAVPTKATTTPPAGAAVADATPVVGAVAAVAVVASAPARPVSADPRTGRVDLPRLVPRLPDEQRDAARIASRAIRKDPAAEPVTSADARSWALVSRVMSNRRASERAAAQLQAVALLQPVPMRAELMPSDGGWRAVFWPFPSAQDAEKVRLALADKGLPLAVVEF